MATVELQRALQLNPAFMELQGRLVDATNKLKQVAVQLKSRENDRRKAILTGQELSTMPASTNMYKGVGRMFVLSSQEDLLRNQAKNAASAENDVNNMLATKAYLERQIKETESNIKELLKANPDLARAVLQQP